MKHCMKIIAQLTLLSLALLTAPTAFSDTSDYNNSSWTSWGTIDNSSSSWDTSNDSFSFWDTSDSSSTPWYLADDTSTTNTGYTSFSDVSDDGSDWYSECIINTYSSCNPSQYDTEPNWTDPDPRYNDGNGNGPVYDVLLSGTGLDSHVSNENAKMFVFSGGSKDVTITLSGLSNDADLYVKKGTTAYDWPSTTTYDCRSYLSGVRDESCTLDSESDDIFYVTVYGYESADFTVTAVKTDRDEVIDTPVSNNALTSGSAVSGNVGQGDWVYYTIEASAEATVLDVTMSNLSADVDLYVKKGAKPTLDSYDCRPYEGNLSKESCVLKNTSAGTWYIAINGYKSGTFSLKATLSAAVSTVLLDEDASVEEGSWKVFNDISIPVTAYNVTIEMTNLTADVDLYAHRGDSWPTDGEYDCRPYSGSTTPESCSLFVGDHSSLKLAVSGYRAGSFHIKVSYSE
jgi:hypothetical protein